MQRGEVHLGGRVGYSTKSVCCQGGGRARGVGTTFRKEKIEFEDSCFPCCSSLSWNAGLPFHKIQTPIGGFRWLRVESLIPTVSVSRCGHTYGWSFRQSLRSSDRRFRHSAMCTANDDNDNSNSNKRRLGRGEELCVVMEERRRKSKSILAAITRSYRVRVPVFT